MRAVIVRNSSREGAGRITGILREAGIGWDTVDLEAGGAMPDPAGYDMVFVLGGPDSANDDTETMRQERRAVRAALDRGIPFFGICLGMQVLGRVAGGEVVRCPQRETGVADPAGRAYAMRLTEAGLADPLCAGLPPEIPVFQLHGEMVVPSPEIIVLAEGLWCPVQLIRAGRNAYGIQGHLEADRGMITAWAGEDPALALLDKQALMDAFGRNEESYGRYARIMITNFIAIARRGADAGKAGA